MIPRVRFTPIFRTDSHDRGCRSFDESVTSSCAISKARSTRFTFTFIVAQQRTGRQESCPKNIVRSTTASYQRKHQAKVCSVVESGELWLSVVVHPLVLATAPQSRVPYRTNFLSGYVPHIQLPLNHHQFIIFSVNIIQLFVSASLSKLLVAPVLLA